ncbi:MAG: gluconokinase [Parasphingorhabdus sp.]|jgi:gluconokinase
MNMAFSVPVVIVVMGVSGCGKSTFGQSLCRRLSARFIEGDQLHPAENIEKMSRGEPLTDADRQPWLNAVAIQATQVVRDNQTAVVACSALKSSYRDIFRGIEHQVRFAHLFGSRSTILQRMGRRTDHFMPASLLDSQLDTLESTATEVDVKELNLENTIEVNLQRFLHFLDNSPID